MWGLDRFQRPAWSTSILIPASFLCGILAAVFIAVGENRTKRTEKVKERLRVSIAMGHHATYSVGSDAGTWNGSTDVVTVKMGNGHGNVERVAPESA
ncbi:hypothetical protein MVEN_01236100 [Mycena venus]|uniref:Uncharacterized protein n=1 Tax=Mycena venus TaxID=2733690 RepID=A0A8H6Y6E9_9AGAR|nr:hypothetical protein MVEN_01236100 [Mycena venus]